MNHPELAEQIAKEFGEPQAVKALEEMEHRIFKATREAAADAAQKVLSQTHVVKAEWQRPIEAVKAIRGLTLADVLKP